jgi:hypothetical protein
VWLCQSVVRSGSAYSDALAAALLASNAHNTLSQGGVGAVYMQRSSDNTTSTAPASLWQTVSATVDVIVRAAASGARSATSTVLMEGFSPLDALGAAATGRYLDAAWASAGRNAKAALQLPPYSVTARAYQLAPETLEVAAVGDTVTPPVVLARGIVQDAGYKRGSQLRLWAGLAAGESHTLHCSRWLLTVGHLPLASFVAVDY